MMYMRPALICSGVGSISAFAVMMKVDAEAFYDTVVFLTLLKMILLAMCIALFWLVRNDSTRYFFINLGLSPKKLVRWGIALDCAVYFIGVFLILLFRYGF